MTSIQTFAVVHLFIITLKTTFCNHKQKGKYFLASFLSYAKHTHTQMLLTQICNWFRFNDQSEENIYIYIKRTNFDFARHTLASWM